MAEFHFIRPWWLAGAVIVVILGFIAWRFYQSQRGWARIIPDHLRHVLLPSDKSMSLRWPLVIISSALTLTCVALAGPTWQRLPQPVYNLQAGSVVIMDMSLSVYSTDISPNRLSQMRFKATDLVRDKLDGEIGLVAYAADAFTISPLTSDGANLGNLIRALSPDIMPNLGSYPLRALNLADQLLRDAGHAEGDIYWLTDGIDSRDVIDINDFISRTNHRINVLAVGTAEGAPIQLPDGRMLRDSADNIVIPQLITGNLETLAQRSGGRFAVVQSDQEDINYLSSLPPRTREGEASQLQAGDQWLDQGAWFIPIIMLLLLPLARRGILVGFVAIVAISLGSYSPSLLAAEREPLSWQEQLWQTPYQQADQALRNGDYETAAAIAQDPWQRGTANYRAGNYDQALVDFSQLDSAEGFYNQGNALMQMQRYDEAANAYDAALKRRPNWPAAQQNRELAEQLKKQQEQQQQQGEQKGQQQTGQQSSNQQSGQQGDSNSEQGSDTTKQTEESSTSPADEEQQRQQKEQQEAEAGEQQQSAENGEQKQPLNSASGDPTSEEMQQQMQQWLNRIEDNPAELLRQKMRYEAQQRRRQNLTPGVEKQW
jgi:Ca-activated chloride channel family protein